MMQSRSARAARSTPAIASPSGGAPKFGCAEKTSEAGLVVVDIRFVTDPVEARVVEELQQRVWGMKPREVVPYHQLVVAAKWGGTLLIAYEDGVAVGFCYGFVGLDGSEPVLCSHMLAVLEEHRAKNLGYLLKVAQRDHARERGFDRIVWTFDPLESRNGRLNLHKLGATSNKYLVDTYGAMRDALNQGMPSDRLLVDWHTDTLTIDERPGDKSNWPRDVPVLNEPVPTTGLPSPGPMAEHVLGGPTIRIAVGADIDALKATEGELVMDWRLNLREAFQLAFANGYRTVDLVPPVEGVAFYVLTRDAA
jgi:predicted GNAT superfamily acetyltransferase